MRRPARLPRRIHVATGQRAPAAIIPSFFRESCVRVAPETVGQEAPGQPRCALCPSLSGGAIWIVARARPPHIHAPPPRRLRPNGGVADRPPVASPLQSPGDGRRKTNTK